MIHCAVHPIVDDGPVDHCQAEAVSDGRLHCGLQGPEPHLDVSCGLKTLVKLDDFALRRLELIHSEAGQSRLGLNASEKNENGSINQVF
jgi:hypothetical protein